MKGIVTTLIAMIPSIVLQLPQTADRKDITDAESYAVYHSVLLDQWPIRVARAQRLVIGRDSVTDDRCVPSPLPADWRRVLENYKMENTGSRRILPNQNLPRPYVLVDVSEIYQFFRPPVGNLEKGWARYHELYPDSGGYIQLSAVGFDGSRRRALVYASHHCGGLCGGGGFELLEKRNGRWERANLKGVTRCGWSS